MPNLLVTRFNVGSIEKCFVAAIIMQLVQEGKLGLTDPLNDYFPECPYATAGQIQVKHLLDHTGGMGDYRRAEGYQDLSETAKSIADVLPFVFGQEPEIGPGEEWRYSNTGYLLLKAIVEKVTGLTYKQVLDERILRPTGMLDTVLFSAGDLLAQRASGYHRGEDGVGFVRAISEPATYAGGGLYTTVLDLLLFDQALYGDGLLTKESKELMFTPVEPSRHYGYGWIVVPFGGGRAIYHGGSSDGYNAEFRRYPDKGYTVIVLSNYDGTSSYELANKIDSMLFGYTYSLATKYDLNFRLGEHFKDKMKDYKKAITFFDKNLKGPEPHLPSLYESASAKLHGKFDQKEAIEQLDLYIQLAGESADTMMLATVWARKGEAYEQLKNKRKAIQCYEKIREIDPNFPGLEDTIARLKKK
jgi:CubicO group peptidase (beta-lactamase class C family)